MPAAHANHRDPHYRHLMALGEALAQELAALRGKRDQPAIDAQEKKWDAYVAMLAAYVAAVPPPSDES